MGAESLPTVQALLYQEERYEEAESLAQRILRTCEQQYGEIHVMTAATLGALAQACQKQEKYPEAEHYYRRVLHIYEELYGPEHMHSTATLALLARCLIDMGNFYEAEEASRRLLTLSTWQKRSQEALPLLNLALREAGKPCRGGSILSPFAGPTGAKMGKGACGACSSSQRPGTSVFETAQLERSRVILPAGGCSG